MASDGIKLKRLTQLEAEERETRENRKEKKPAAALQVSSDKGKNMNMKKRDL